MMDVLELLANTAFPMLAGNGSTGCRRVWKQPLAGNRAIRVGFQDTAPSFAEDSTVLGVKNGLICAWTQRRVDGETGHRWQLPCLFHCFWV